MDKQKFFETLQRARELSELALKAMEKKEKVKADGFEEVFEEAGLSLKTILAKTDKLCILTLCVILKELEDEYGAYLGLDIEEGKEKTDGRI